jgi:hypothetical protein
MRIPYTLHSCFHLVLLWLDIFSSFRSKTYYVAAEFKKNFIFGNLNLRGGGKRYQERTSQYRIWRQQLWKAAGCGDTDAIKRIVNEGANVNVPDTDGWTACHWAASKGHDKAISLLSKLGADINLKDSHGSTPLHWAAAHGHRAAIEVLCSLGAKLEAQDSVSTHVELATPLFRPTYFAPRAGRPPPAQPV